jgi:hypothetical protein
MILTETLKQAKVYLAQNKITQEEFDRLFALDPTPNKQYLGWLSKQFIVSGKQMNLEFVKNQLEEYDVLKKRAGNREELKQDISQYKDYEEFEKSLETVNSKKNYAPDLQEEDYIVLIDSPDLFIVTPGTHEASREFCQGMFSLKGQKDSPWCIGYNTDSNFNSYHHDQHLTIYLILVRNLDLIKDFVEKFGVYDGQALRKVCLMVRQDDVIAHATDENNSETGNLKGQRLQYFIDSIGLDVTLK